MKFVAAFLFILFMLPALASSPEGLFQIDQGLSKVTGVIDIKKVFNDSKFMIVSENTSFEAEKVTGTLDDFELTGNLTYNNKTHPVTFKGKYFGMVDLDKGQKKIALTLSSDPVTLRIFAAKPSEETTALIEEVQDIIH